MDTEFFLSYPKFGSQRESSLDCHLDLVMLRDLDCLTLDWLLVVNKALYDEGFR